MTLASIQEMGNCLSWMKSRRKGQKTLTLAIFGIDNAGKTVTVKGLQGEGPEDVAPTIGFQSNDFRFGRYDITMYDLGGGKGIRGIWNIYYAEIFGLVYVIDSSAMERIKETKAALDNILSDPRISGKPVLILANKQDVNGAMDEIDLCDSLSLESSVNQYKTPCRIEMCSATVGHGRKLDKGIKQGFKWLISSVEQNYVEIEKRVAEDSEKQRKVEAEERRQRAERVRKIKEEREREAELTGVKDEADCDNPGDNTMVDGDPFKPVDIAELTAKEEKMKEEKRKKRSKETTKITPSEPDKPSPASDSAVSLPSVVDSPIKEEDYEQRGSRIEVRSPNTDAEEEARKRHENEARVSGSDLELSPRRHGGRVKTPTDLFIVDHSHARSKLTDHDINNQAFINDHYDVTMNGNATEIRGPAKLDSLDGNDTPTEGREREKKKKKKRKKKAKHNQTVPVDDDDDVITSRTEPPTSTWLAGAPDTPSSGDAPVAPPRGGRLQPLGAPVPATRARVLEPLSRSIDIDADTKAGYAEKWSLELPSMVPNADDDDIIL